MKVTCEGCQTEFNKHPSQVKKTKHNFCSRSCAGKYNGKQRKGPYKDRNEQKEKARELRRKNLGYRTIAKQIDVPWGTIANWVSDIEVDESKVRINSGCFDNQKAFDDLLTKYARKKRLINIRGYACEYCGISTWREEEIVIELHHIDGDESNNKKGNLILLCPNCHSQTPNYRNRKR